VSENINPSSDENRLIDQEETKKQILNTPELNIQESTTNLEQNRFECRNCGYIYDPSEEIKS